MARESLERRVATLERRLDELLTKSAPSVDSWRETVGMFTNDTLMKEIDAAGRAWREADRRKAKRRRSAAASSKS